MDVLIVPNSSTIVALWLHRRNIDMMKAQWDNVESLSHHHAPIDDGTMGSIRDAIATSVFP